MEKKKFNWKPLVAVIVFVVLAVAMVLVWRGTRPSTVEGSKTIYVEVVHKDGSVADFTYQTDKEYLGEALLEEGLIAGSESEFGLYVETVDGETANYDADQSYWWLTCNGEDSQTGADQVVLADGDHFVWTYTVG